MSYAVIDHCLDENEGVYRLTVGTVVEEQTPKTDEDGKTVLDSDGDPIMETASWITASETIVFAADDPQWEGKEPMAIATAQREIALQKLTERDLQHEEAERAREENITQLPGVGETL